MLNETAMNYLTERGIDPETADAYGIESVPGGRGGHEEIAIPFRVHGKTVNHKYRLLADKASVDNVYRQDKGGEQWFWNADCLKDQTLARRRLIITEGEFDALIALQCGESLVVSVPSGAPSARPSSDEAHERQGERGGRFEFITKSRADMDGIEEIVLATDGDPPGRILAEQLAIRLGRPRCKWVEYPFGCKDLNDVHRAAGESGVRRILDGARWYMLNDVCLMSEIAPVPPTEALSTGMPNLDPHFKVRPGDLSVMTGAPGIGKTVLFNDLWARYAVLNRRRVCFASFEQHPRADYYEEIAAWYEAHFDLLSGDRALLPFDDWLDDHFSFIVPEYGPDEAMDLAWLLERMAAAVVRFAANVIVIDPWNEIEHVRDRDETETEYINRSLRELRLFAGAYKVHVAVVAHPRKMDSDKDGNTHIPSLYDISGSSAWANKPDVGIVLYQNKGETCLWVRKSRQHRRIGRPGKTWFHYNEDTRHFIGAEDPDEVDRMRKN